MFDLNEKIMKKARSLGFDDVAVLSEHSERKQVRFANGEVTVAKLWVERKSTLFLARDKKLVSTEISNYDDSHVDEVLKRMLSITSTMERREDYYGIAEGPFKYGEIEETYDPRVLEVDPIDQVEAAVNATNLERVAGVLYVDHPRIYLSTSNGVEAEDEGTGIEISVRAFKDDLASGHATSSARVLSRFKSERAGDKAGEIARMVSSPKVGDAGKYDVVFDPLAIGNLFSMMGQFLSAMAVEAGFSFLIDKIGKKVASEIFTLRDVGNLPNGYATRKFDDEGVPTRSTEIIENGILKTYLLNTSFAKKYGMENTANAGVVMPRPWNLCVEPGDHREVEIFDVKRGIYVTNIWYTRFQNYVTGDFSTIPRDGIFLIEDGEVKGAIKNIRISDNMLRLLSSIDAISHVGEQIHWWEAETPVITPYVRVRDVGITRATQ